MSRCSNLPAQHLQGQGPQSPAAVDEGLSQALGISAASWAQKSGLKRGQESPPSLPGEAAGEAAGSGWGWLSVHRGHLAVMQAELLGLETEAGDAVGHVDPRGRRA